MTRLVILLLLFASTLASVHSQDGDGGCRDLFELLQGKSWQYVEWSSEQYGWPSLEGEYFDERVATCHLEGGGWIEAQRASKSGSEIILWFASSAVWADSAGEHVGIHDFYGPHELIKLTP